MATTPHPSFRTRARERFDAARGHRELCRVEIVENTLAAVDEPLAADVEAQVHRLLSEEALGEVRVRVKACHDDEDRLRFICKVETPPQVDVEILPPWRWWSGLLDSADAFAASLDEALRMRRDRLGVGAR